MSTYRVSATSRPASARPANVDHTVDVLGYFVGYQSWRRLVTDLSWFYGAAETWRREHAADTRVQLCESLLRTVRGGSDSKAGR